MNERNIKNFFEPTAKRGKPEKPISIDDGDKGLSNADPFIINYALQNQLNFFISLPWPFNPIFTKTWYNRSWSIIIGSYQLKCLMEWGYYKGEVHIL